jgi:hypothetical protein
MPGEKVLSSSLPSFASVLPLQCAKAPTLATPFNDPTARTIEEYQAFLCAPVNIKKHLTARVVALRYLTTGELPGYKDARVAFMRECRLRENKCSKCRFLMRRCGGFPTRIRLLPSSTTRREGPLAMYQKRTRLCENSGISGCRADETVR